MRTRRPVNTLVWQVLICAAVLSIWQWGYNLHAVTSGKDAQGEVSVRIEESGLTISGPPVRPGSRNAGRRFG